jgi:hypothetical protein
VEVDLFSAEGVKISIFHAVVVAIVRNNFKKFSNYIYIVN